MGRNVCKHMRTCYKLKMLANLKRPTLSQNELFLTHRVLSFVVTGNL